MKTMKRVLLLAAFCIALLNVSTAYSQVRLGVRGGVDVIDRNVNWDMLKIENRIGYQLGLSVDAKVPLIGLEIESGLLFGQKKYDSEERQQDVSAGISDYGYFSIPIYLKKSFTVLDLAGVYAKAGVFGNVRAAGGKVTFQDQIYKPRKFQKGLSVGVGVIVLKHIELGMNYNHRLGDFYSSQDVDKFDLGKLNKTGRNTWTVTLAYYL